MANEINNYIKERAKKGFINKKGESKSFYSRKYKRLFPNYADFIAYTKKDIDRRFNRGFIKRNIHYKHPKKTWDNPQKGKVYASSFWKSYLKPRPKQVSLS